MRIALVLADNRPGRAARVATEQARGLRVAGHDAVVVVVRDLEGPAFEGHAHLPDGTLTLAQAACSGTDAALALSWRAWYAMFALEAGGFGQIVLRDERDGAAAALVERAYREPDAAVLATDETVRARLAALGREAAVVPVGVDPGRFAPRGPGGAGGRVLVRGPGAALARRAGAREIWQLGAGDAGADRQLGPVPLDAMPALLRCCDVLLDLLPGLTALEMRACGGAVVSDDDEAAVRRALAGPPAAVTVPDWRESTARLERALASLPAMPAWRRAELAAVARLLEPPAPRPEPVERWGRARTLAGHGVRAARRLLRRPSPARPPGPDVALRPGEPVLFVGQPQYFRSAYHDAVRDGWGLAAPLSITALGALADLPALARRTGARTAVVFQPELLATAPRAAADLRAGGVRLVGYATEPLPHDGQRQLHWDQVRRLDDLRRARGLPWDLLIHHDPASAGVVAREAIAPVAIHPLPVSEALFHAEPGAPVEHDVCFLGWSTPHREAFLHTLKCRYRTLHVAHGIFDEEARRMMNRSRLVVNLHAHAYPGFENRCVQALFCGRPLVGEPLSNDLLAPGVDFLVARTPDELLHHAEALLDLGLPPPRPTFDRARFLASSLRDLLAGAAS